MKPKFCPTSASYKAAPLPPWPCPIFHIATEVCISEFLKKKLVCRCAIVGIHFQDILLSVFLKRLRPCYIFLWTFEVCCWWSPSPSAGQFFHHPRWFSASPPQLFSRRAIANGIHRETNPLFEPESSLCDIISHPSSCGHPGVLFKNKTKTILCLFLYGLPRNEVQKDSCSLLVLTAFQTATENVSQLCQHLLIECFPLPPRTSFGTQGPLSSSSWFSNNQKQKQA